MVLGSGGLHDESERAMNKQRSSTHEARVSWLEYEQVIGERLVDIKCRKNEKKSIGTSSALLGSFLAMLLLLLLLFPREEIRRTGVDT